MMRWKEWRVVEGVDLTFSFGFLGWRCSYLPLHTLHTFHTLHSYKERVINNKRSDVLPGNARV